MTEEEARRGVEGDAERKELDTVDLQRLGLLTLAAVDLSADRLIHVSQSRRGVYRVDVMAQDLHHTARSETSLLEAMDEACGWLRRMAKPLALASKVLRFRRTGQMVGGGLLLLLGGK